MARRKPRTTDHYQRARAAETGVRSIVLGRVVLRRDAAGAAFRVVLTDGEQEGYWICYDGLPAYGPYTRDDLERESQRTDNSASFVKQIREVLDAANR